MIGYEGQQREGFRNDAKQILVPAYDHPVSLRQKPFTRRPGFNEGKRDAFLTNGNPALKN
jgi:hypothetical protein